MMEKLEMYTKYINGVWFGVLCDKDQVFATTFTKTEEHAVKSLQESIPHGTEVMVSAEPSILAEKTLISAKSVYDGKGEAEKIALATEGFSHFKSHVLEITRLIPVGYVSSYGALSETAGGSPRAVGGVMATNPFAPIVPCHRVVKSDLSLGGYGGGLDLKEQILTREKRGEILPKAIPVKDGQLRVFPVERVLGKTE